MHMEVSEPKLVNSDYIQYGVNSLSLGGLHILIRKRLKLNLFNSYILMIQIFRPTVYRVL